MTAGGTAFEERWVSTDAVSFMSSNETLAADMRLGAALDEDGDLRLWVTHVSSEFCEFSEWQLAVDKTIFQVNAEIREDARATELHPADDAESATLLQDFEAGESVAVRFRANCDNMFYSNFVGTATMTYSLFGSSEALQFLSDGQ